ncbi:hypothetical protein CcaCcLH18_12112 [Colletotrichum camelliae]|nr:hypothetical protein CcaCcLH18_12112 [Colletotrichum camelliae]
MTIFINPLDREMKRALPMFERGRFFIFVDDHMSEAVDDACLAVMQDETEQAAWSTNPWTATMTMAMAPTSKMLYGHFAEADSSRSTAVNLDDAIEPMFLALSITHGRFDIIPDASGPSFARIQCATDFPQREWRAKYGPQDVLASN